MNYKNIKVGRYYMFGDTLIIISDIIIRNDKYYINYDVVDDKIVDDKLCWIAGTLWRDESYKRVRKATRDEIIMAKL